MQSPGNASPARRAALEFRPILFQRNQLSPLRMGLLPIGTVTSGVLLTQKHTHIIALVLSTSPGGRRGMHSARFKVVRAVTATALAGLAIPQSMVAQAADRLVRPSEW